jgi:hypothetical protein
MKRLTVLVLLLCPVCGSAQDPQLASVRIKSHGASATVIATSPGKSWALGCCHMFFGRGEQIDPAALVRPLRIDGPPQPQAPARLTQGRVRAYDSRADLSLLEIDNGPFYFIPVAPRGHQPSRNVWSLGYDEMRWPLTTRPATLLLTQGGTTYTREKPWHGRSGGGLIDVDARLLIGVVQGYEAGPAPYQRGLYVAHETILRFLEPHLR